MLSQLRPAIVMMPCFTLLFGLAYPLAITGVAQVAFPDQAGGSLVQRRGGPGDRLGPDRPGLRQAGISASRARRRPATAMTRPTPPAPTSARWTPTWPSGSPATPPPSARTSPAPSIPADAVTTSGSRPRPRHLAGQRPPAGRPHRHGARRPPSPRCRR